MGARFAGRAPHFVVMHGLSLEETTGTAARASCASYSRSRQPWP